MKKYITLILILILSSSVYAACLDNDDGINYKEKGFCKDTFDNEGTDFCRPGELIEYYCHDSVCKAQLKICSECVNGVCLSKEADVIIEANRPPEIDLFVMTTPGKTEVAFKADVYDKDNEMVVFTIDFGDGEKASNKADVVHDYKTNGTFTVTITARDLSGGESTFSKEITIEQQKMVEKKIETKTIQEKTTAKTFFGVIKSFFRNLFSKN